MPTMPATLWVPERRSRSCPPPSMTGTSLAPWRTTRAPTPLGPPNLWAETAIRRGVGRRGGDVEPGGGLHRVGVEHGPGRPLGHEGGHGGQRLDGADLVVGQHHRHDGGPLVEGGGEGVEVDDAVGVDADLGHPEAVAAQPVTAVEDGVVLDGGGDHPVAEPPVAGGAGGALDGQVVGLGARRR